MELKKGMYVITDDRIEIGKIKDFCTCERCKERGFYEPIIDNPNIFITNYDKECKFHGYKFYDNIIDLIEEGDYANGILVERIWERNNNSIFFNTMDDEIMFQITNKTIENIVTKEQFESIKYEVE